MRAAHRPAPLHLVDTLEAPPTRPPPTVVRRVSAATVFYATVVAVGLVFGLLSFAALHPRPALACCSAQAEAGR